LFFANIDGKTTTHVLLAIRFFYTLGVYILQYFLAIANSRIIIIPD